MVSDLATHKCKLTDAIVSFEYGNETEAAGSGAAEEEIVRETQKFAAENLPTLLSQ